MAFAHPFVFVKANERERPVVFRSSGDPLHQSGHVLAEGLHHGRTFGIPLDLTFSPPKPMFQQLIPVRIPNPLPVTVVI